MADGSSKVLSGTGRLFDLIRRASVGGSNCWLWPGTINGDGYGHFGRRNGRAAHRIVYEALRGQIPKGMSLIHRCDVTSCVNPDHLRIGTHEENMEDKVLKGRARGNPYGRRGIEPRLIQVVLQYPGTQREAALATGLSRSTVANIHRRAREARAACWP